MKNVLALFASAILLASCTQKVNVEPQTVSTENVSKNKGLGPQTTYSPLSFCYTTTQTSSDSWSMSVYKSGGNPLVYQGTFEISYDIVTAPSGVTTHYGWYSVTSWPYGLPGSGNGGVTTNIVIRQGLPGVDRDGNPTVFYTYYNVGHC